MSRPNAASSAVMMASSASDFEIGFSFSVAGLLFPYHLGVASALREEGLLVDGSPLAGACAKSECDSLLPWSGLGAAQLSHSSFAMLALNSFLLSGGPRSLFQSPHFLFSSSLSLSRHFFPFFSHTASAGASGGAIAAVLVGLDIPLETCISVTQCAFNACRAGSIYALQSASLFPLPLPFPLSPLIFSLSFPSPLPSLKYQGPREELQEELRPLLETRRWGGEGGLRGRERERERERKRERERERLSLTQLIARIVGRSCRRICQVPAW